MQDLYLEIIKITVMLYKRVQDVIRNVNLCVTWLVLLSVKEIHKIQAASAGVVTANVQEHVFQLQV